MGVLLHTGKLQLTSVLYSRCDRISMAGALTMWLQQPHE